MLLCHPSATFEGKPTSSSFLGPCNHGDFAQRVSSGLLPLHRRNWRQRLILMQQGGGKENSGQEPPESLFMKELKRRGIPQSSNEEKSNVYGSGGTEPLTEEKEAQSSGPSVKRMSESPSDQSQSNQRQQSMALNSEGLEGLIPRARALLILGGSFFLSFWPLILSSLTIFVALYIYYGPIFIHSGNRAGGGQGQYADPYELLKERIPSEIGPSFVPNDIR